ncbi:MAG: hypothetical protein HRT42_05995, partial [Campylobacteraceae bacterium]|nr:hypothetical protein [Campylobacteraceae bacterium]
MKKIILNVDDKNLSVVLNILENLKHGLIKDLSVQSDLNKSKEVYSSKNEDTHNKNKYSTSSAYKKKLYKNETKIQFQQKDESFNGGSMLLHSAYMHL